MDHFNPPTLPPTAPALERGRRLYERWAIAEQEQSNSGIPQVAWEHLVDADRKRWADLAQSVYDDDFSAMIAEAKANAGKGQSANHEMMLSLGFTVMEFPGKTEEEP